MILIIVDDIGVDQIGVYAENYFPPDSDYLPCTPHIDDLAGNGIRFTNAWSNPVCTPTRSLIMTGRPACETGMGMVTSPVRPMQVGLSTEFTTIADLTPGTASAVGKYHLADETQWPTHPLDLGFDTFLGPQDNLQAYPQNGPSYDDWHKWDAQSCDSIDGSDYATAETTQDAIDIIDGFGDGGSFLWLAYNASHGPFHCPDPSHCGDGTNCGTYWCGSMCDDAVGTPDSTRVRTRAMTQALDNYIGELITHVDFSNTAVILVGDNGTPKPATYPPFIQAHGKGTLYQGGINVPLIVRPPDGTAPDYEESPHCNTLVSATDLYATIADYLGVSASVPSDVDSYSLRPLIESGDCTDFGRNYVYAERFSPTFRPDNGKPPAGYLAKRHDRAVRNAKYKLIEFNSLAGTEHKLYRLWDPDPNNHDPFPHNPEDLDYPGSDPLHSAFEGTAVPEPYGGDDLDAFNELKDYLATRDLYDDYDMFPFVAEVEADVKNVRTVEFNSFAPPHGGTRVAGAPATVSYFCDESRIEVGRKQYPNGSQTYRTFLEFDLCEVNCAVQNPDDLVSVALEVPVRAGALFAASEIEVYSIDADEDKDDVSYYDLSEAECENLYNTTGTNLYGSAGGWAEFDGQTGFCVPVTKTIRLDGVLDELYEEMIEQGDERLSMALTLTFPTDPDLVALHDISGSLSSDEYKLRVYHSSTTITTPCPCGGGVGGAPAPAPPGNNRLEQSYPNPFNPTTTIAYSVPVRAHVTLSIYDVGGRLVRRLVGEVQDPRARYEVTWDGRDDAGGSVASGVYFYRLTVGSYTETRKMLMIK